MNEKERRHELIRKICAGFYERTTVNKLTDADITAIPIYLNTVHEYLEAYGFHYDKECIEAMLDNITYENIKPRCKNLKGYMAVTRDIAAGILLIVSQIAIGAQGGEE